MRKSKLVRLCTVVCAVSAPCCVHAQQTESPPASAEANAQGIGDIVVTAQRRTEDAQRTALSIEVLGGEQLRNVGVSNPDDITKVVPGVQVSGGATTQIYVRGVGDFGVTAVANPAVVTSLDGVAISRPQAISGNLFDLERVEVLRGPQGTLYGRNASGGALNLLTAQPRLGELSGYAEGTVGNYDLLGIEGAVNAPLGGRGALRLSYQLTSRDGYLSDGSDDDKHQSVRLQTRFELGDRLTVRALASYTHLGGRGPGLTIIPAPPALSPWTGNTSDVAGDLFIKAAADAFAASGGQSPPPFLLANPKDYELFQDVDSYAGQAQLDYDLGGVTLTAIPGYRRTETRITVPTNFLYSLGGRYGPAGERADGETSDQYSLEIRLSGDTERLDWVVGAYGFKEDQSTDFVLRGGPILSTRNSLDLSTEALAAFGQATWGVLDGVRLTGGVRYTRDKRGASNFQVQAISPSITVPAAVTGLPPAPCLPETGAAPGSLCPLVNQAPGFYDSAVTFERVTWKAGFEADLAERSLLFGDVSTGFKAGGFNQAVSLTTPTELNPFRPETVTAYTLGIKNRFLDNRLQVNAEAFYLDYNNLQLSGNAFDGAGLVSIATQNAGKARVLGGNLNVIAKPWRGGTLRGSVEYLDAEYREYLVQQPAAFVSPQRTTCAISAPNAGGIVTVDCSGKTLIRSPRWSGAVGFGQEVDLAGGTLAFDADAAFATSRYLTTDFLPSQRADGYVNVSLSLSYRPAGDRWLIGAFVRNLTNEVIYTGGGGTQSPFVDGWTTSAIAPPRTYGARFRVSF
ncbi:TonB-dependent receptor [Sphingomonas adhaesiva]|uniref:TonB-dependent receptor n=1 Tax=Sphingomonas adhaesiva TaxID=28212 RepID=A0A2A4I381_9SPHN|nr:TonB-dependent receptor [Sphingomonas adhaesiva]PCG13101.1 TonB-dependent receptor [Sphingomonas adhaesiva]